MTIVFATLYVNILVVRKTPLYLEIMKGYLLVNFGGPRNLGEIKPFLNALLTDIDVIHPLFPQPLHKMFFSFVAKKRAKTVTKDYEEIGGKSNIFEETETLAKLLEKRLQSKVFTFHRYLRSTHSKTLQQIENTELENIIVLPLFPQFTYATTGSCARFFCKYLSPKALDKLQWIKSYSTHFAFISLWQKILHNFLEQRQIKKEEACFLFSAHGLPQDFIDQGDPYEKECQVCVEKVMEGFKDIPHLLSFQSQFGKQKWIGPSTAQACDAILSWYKGRKHIVFIPISFTSDHIETLFEIEKSYMPIIAEKKLNAFRVPACYAEPSFLESIMAILQDSSYQKTHELVRTTQIIR